MSETGPKCNYTNERVDEIAQNCNQRKLAAKRADVGIYVHMLVTAFLGIYICMYVHEICTYVYTYVSDYVCFGMYVHMYVCMYMRYVYVHLCTVFIYVQWNLLMYVHIPTFSTFQHILRYLYHYRLHLYVSLYNWTTFVPWKALL